MELLLNINSFLVEIKFLIISIFVPLLTFLVTHKAATSSEKRARDDRKMQLELSRRLKLADFRQAWINDVRADLADIISNCANLNTSDVAASYATNGRIASILMRMNPSEEKAQRIVNLLNGLQSLESSERDVRLLDLTNAANDFLRTEWARLKIELEQYDEVLSKK